MQKAASRQQAIAAGANDGRFRNKVIPNKKAEARKRGWD